MSHTFAITKTAEAVPGKGWLVRMAAIAETPDRAGVFVLKETDGSEPLFQTVADPCLMAEFPLGEPEWPGHFYRTAEVEVLLPSLAEREAFERKIAVAAEALRRNLAIVNDDSLLETTEHAIRGHVVRLSVTGGSWAYKRLSLDLDGQRRLIMHPSKSMGKLFTGVVPFGEESDLGHRRSKAGWLADSVELVTYASLAGRLADRLLRDLRG